MASLNIENLRANDICQLKGFWEISILFEFDDDDAYALIHDGNEIDYSECIYGIDDCIIKESKIQGIINSGKCGDYAILCYDDRIFFIKKSILEEFNKKCENDPEIGEKIFAFDLIR